MNNIRIIIQSKSEKLLSDINNLKYFIDNFDLIIIDEYEIPNNIKKYKYNLHIDTIDENIYNILKCDITILYVNDEYVVFQKYLKRISYKEEKLILLKNVVNIYITNSEYSKNILINKHKINSNNIIFIKKLINPNLYNLNKENKKKNMIYFKPDIYSYQKNINLLKVWAKYFLNRKEKLIIHYTRYNDNLVTYFKKISGLKINIFNKYYYKNIILFKDNKFYDDYKDNILLSIINYSNYNIYNIILSNIIQNINIITYNNILTKELLFNNKFFFNIFNEIEIKENLDKFFSSNKKNQYESYENDIDNNILNKYLELK